MIFAPPPQLSQIGVFEIKYKGRERAPGGPKSVFPDFTKKGKIFFIFRQDPCARMISFHYLTKILRRVSYTDITAPKDLIRKHYIFKTIRPMETILTFLEISKERLHFTFYGHGEKTSLSSEKIRQNTFFCPYLRIF